MVAWLRTKGAIVRWLHFLPLILGAAWLVQFWLSFQHNFTISDPWQYARHAYWVKAGSFLEHSAAPTVFGHRFGVFVPVALVYALFGVTPLTTMLVPLSTGLAILFVTWWVLPKGAALPGVICAVTCVPLLRGMIELWPDPIATAFMVISVLMLSQRLDAPAKRSTQLLRAGVGVSSWFAAMLAKETAYSLLLIWAGAALLDVFRRRGAVLKWFHAPAVLFGLLLTLGYLWACAHFFGDPFARLHGIDALAGRHFWSFRKPGELETRLTSGALNFFWREYGPLLLAALPGLFVLPSKLRIWSFYTVVAVLTYWFGSTTLHSYQPLPTIWRMSLPCAPGFFITGGYFIYWLCSRIGNWLWAPLGPLLIVSTSALAVLVTLPKVREQQATWRTFPDLAAMELVKSELRSHPNTRYLLISAEYRTMQYTLACLGFSPPANVTLAYAGELDAELLARADKALLFIDPRHLPDRHPSYARQVLDLRLPALFREGNVRVFATDDVAGLDRLRARRK